jgi:hypothetical protein
MSPSRSPSAALALHAFLLTFLALALASPALAAMDEAEARSLLMAWIKANDPAKAACVQAQPGQYANGGYAFTLTGAGCPAGAPAGERWRIDAWTSEVFVDSGTGRFTIPPAVRDKGSLANVALAARHPGLLPEGARIVEYQPLGASAPDRAYLLWMLSPTRQERQKDDTVYTCPDYSRGSCLSGPTRLTLLDTRTGKARNTLKIKDPTGDGDTFDLPFRIPDRKDYSFTYQVPEGAGKAREGRPKLLRLLDYTGDGAALEFYLASSGNCMLTLYGVFGYSRARDEVVQYPVELTVTAKGKKPETSRTQWLNFWPLPTLKSGGAFGWEVDTSGRGGCLERYDIRFDEAKETFTGTLKISKCEGM